MKKSFICLFILLAGCTQQPSINQEKPEQTDECNACLEEVEKLRFEKETLLQQLEKETVDLAYPIEKNEYYLWMSKQQYADTLKSEPYVLLENSPIGYNGIQKLVLNFNTTDSQKVNEILDQNETKALNLYELNEDYFLKTAGFLWYDVEQYENILSITSNYYVHLLDAGRPGIEYRAYNFNIENGNLMSNEDLLNDLNVDVELLCSFLNRYELMIHDQPIVFEIDDLLKEREMEESYSFYFSIIDGHLVMTYNISAEVQNGMENYGKFFIPLDEITIKP